MGGGDKNSAATGSVGHTGSTTGVPYGGVLSAGGSGSGSSVSLGGGGSTGGLFLVSGRNDAASASMDEVMADPAALPFFLSFLCPLSNQVCGCG